MSLRRNCETRGVLHRIITFKILVLGNCHVFMHEAQRCNASQDGHGQLSGKLINRFLWYLLDLLKVSERQSAPLYRH